MKFFRSKANIIMSSVIFLLSAALMCSGVVIVKKNSYIKDVKMQISENQAVIQEKSEKQKQLEAQIKELEAENSKTSEDVAKQLEALESEKQHLLEEKEKLQTENSSLKAKIEQLSAAKRKAEAQAAINAAASLQNNKADGKVCYLTFDDGPSDNTLKILDILKEYNVKATFFVMNTNKIQYVKRINDEGHAIGLHTATHDYAQVYKSIDAYFNDLAVISNAVKTYTGVESKIIRFPGGSSNQISRNYCSGIMTQLVRLVGERGYSYFDWNVSSGDAAAARVAASTIIYNVKGQSRNKNSVCILMHDTAAKSTTVAALPQIIEHFALEGYRFETFKAGDYGFHHGYLNN